MTNNNVHIRPLTEADKAAWCELYQGYADFYEVPMTTTIQNNTFAWLMDDNHVLSGLVAETAEQQLIGFSHFRAMPSPLRGTDVCFLDDLFVVPNTRRLGAGAALIHAVSDIAKERGWPKIRWITQDHNYAARSLYDKVAVKTLWNTYEIDV